jgi:hypothetical protein
MPYDGQVLIPTLIGSLLSCVATICVLTSYVVYANQQQSFRHALVLNLALAGRCFTCTDSNQANACFRIHQFPEQLNIWHLCLDPWQDHARLTMYHQWLGRSVVSAGE